MLRKLLLPSIVGLAVSMLTLPVQAAPASNATSMRTAAGSSGVEQAHYYRRHHRYYRYDYGTPGYFYGHRHHHRYWRHW